MQCCSRGTRSLRITQPGVENNASSSLRALIAMQHAPCSDDGRYAEYCGRHPMAGQINSSGFIGQGSCSCFSSGHERACHGQMRSTHDVSPQLLAILLWTCGWCCPVAVNPSAATYQELAGITRNDLSSPQHTSRPCRVSGWQSRDER